jgi:hypothetical protein
MKKRFVITGIVTAVAIGSVIIAARFIPTPSYAATGDVHSSFRLPYGTGTWGRGSQGLAWDGQYLYYLDTCIWMTEPQILKLTTAGSIVNSFDPPVPGDWYQKGLAWDGEYLWVSRADDAKEIIKMGTEVVITTPNQLPHDITYLSGNVYEIDGASNGIYVIDVTVTDASENAVEGAYVTLWVPETYYLPSYLPGRTTNEYGHIRFKTPGSFGGGMLTAFKHNFKPVLIDDVTTEAE